MKTFTFAIRSKEDIRAIVKEEIRKELGWIYKELHKLRIRLNDLDKIISKKNER